MNILRNVSLWALIVLGLLSGSAGMAAQQEENESTYGVSSVSVEREDAWTNRGSDSDTEELYRKIVVIAKKDSRFKQALEEFFINYPHKIYSNFKKAPVWNSGMILLLCVALRDKALTDVTLKNATVADLVSLLAVLFPAANIIDNVL